MPFSVGDRVAVEKKQARTDEKVVMLRTKGVVVDVFNACDLEGDHWQYKVRGDDKSYIVFYEGKDEGKIEYLK